MIRLAAILLLFFSQPLVAAERIASLNLCIDQILLNWVAPERIASVTWLSGERNYRGAPIPEHVHLNRGQTEELLHLQPDLILVGEYGAQQAARRLQDMGFKLATIPDAYSLEQLLEQLDALDQALGKNTALAQQRRQLQRLLAQPAREGRASALIFSANNITYGSGMLEHQLLTRASFVNLAASGGLEQLGRISLEEVVALQPDLLVLYGGGEDFALAHLAVRHPVLKTYVQSGRVYTLPAQLSYCPLLAAAEVLQELSEKRKAFVEQE